ncbi:MAG TPA: CDP-diacylglycerol--glycerol-3-phosphate 3-phosphatidyltransferase [Ktedonobacterales bacterium]|nr:CDP-diacylglycerol--glycerol-3-phosphate 3-phosphatidyltransferase [Ktedonobacterales bacterium]
MRNVPNALSFGRLVATIPLFVLILINTPAAFVAATVLFFFASVTDLLDGRLARKYQVVSNLGVFLDLTADKIFVAVLLIALVQVRLAPAWIASVIVTREFLVSGLRSVAAARGVVIPAGNLGKQKTLLTLLGLGGILLSRGLNGLTAFPLGLSTATHAPAAFGDFLLALADAVLLLAVVWTALSAYDYLRRGWGILFAPAQS